MSTLTLVLRAGARDLARNRWLAVYGIALALVTEALFLFGGTGPQVVLSLLNATLLLVPLVALAFGTIHVHASREHVELLLAQPIARGSVFAGLYLGLTIPLALAYFLGVGLPLLLQARAAAMPWAAMCFLLFGGLALTSTGTAVAMAIALRTDERLRAMGLALGAWFVLTIGYDAAVLLLVATFDAWPLERPLLALMMGNPVDVVRVLVLTSLDAAALLGYTGALYRRAFGTAAGQLIALAALTLWCVLPILLARRRFVRRDF